MATIITHALLVFTTISCLQYVENVPGQRILDNKLKFLTDEPFNAFDWKLSKVLDKNEPGNFIVSPLSVKLAIAMLYLGVQGTAAREIEEALRINSTLKESVEQKFSIIMKSIESKEKDYELNIGTKIFYDKSSATINPEFSKKLKEFYNSSVSPIDFKQRSAAIAEINNWSSKTTNGKIQELVTSGDLNDETVIMLLNAIYFKGDWEKPFSENYTQWDTFWVSPQKPVNARMMRIDEDFLYYNMQELKSHLIRLRYAGERFAMYIILPHEVDGLANLARDITPEILAKSLNLMKETQVHLRIPKFKFESTATLVPSLKQLNIKELFSDKASLENIGKSSRGSLMISNIIQKSGIEVNEKGSSAYATTEVLIDSRFGNDDNVFINANHPFVFLIADESKDTIIFTGKVVDPSPSTVPGASAAYPGQVSNQLPTLPSEYESPDSINRIKPSQNEDLSPAYNYFDKEILLKIAQANEGKNIVLSPASIKSSLALLLEGANGLTEKEILDALRLPHEKQAAVAALRAQLSSLNSNDSTLELDNQNKVFLAQDEKLSAKYAQAVIQQYGAEIDKLNFIKTEEARDAINNWVNHVTKGLIPVLVNTEDLDPATRLFLVNTIYFKSNWLNEFDSKLTRVDCFKTSNGCQKANFMTGEFSLNYFEDNELGYRMVEIPFKNEQYSMVIALPHKIDGVIKLLKNLQHHNILALFDSMKKYPVQLTIPRTTIEFSSPLSDSLQKADIKDLFSPNANLSGILEQGKPIGVKDIIHKAKIEINEQGARAAAASGIQVVLLSASMSIDFRADHPFVFFIRDLTKPGFLFEGVLASPDKVGDSSKTANTTPRNVKTTTPYSLMRAPLLPGQTAQLPVRTSVTPQAKLTTRRGVVIGYQSPRPSEIGSVEYPITKP